MGSIKNRFLLREMERLGWVLGEGHHQSLAHDQAKFELVGRISRARALGASFKEIAKYLGIDEGRARELSHWHGWYRRRHRSPIEEYFEQTLDHVECPYWREPLKERRKLVRQWLRYRKAMIDPSPRRDWLVV